MPTEPSDVVAYVDTSAFAKLLRAEDESPAIDIRRRTGLLRPVELRALDAIHLATAMALGSGLGVLFAYDDRLIDAALLQGVPTRSPAPI